MPIFTIVSVEWTDVKCLRHTANYGKGFGGCKRIHKNIFMLNVYLTLNRYNATLPFPTPFIYKLEKGIYGEALTN